jgi:hypothetical protein
MAAQQQLLYALDTIIGKQTEADRKGESVRWGRVTLMSQGNQFLPGGRNMVGQQGRVNSSRLRLP